MTCLQDSENAKEDFFIYINYTQDKDNILNIMQTQQKNPIFEKKSKKSNICKIKILRNK
jgi:hypothetical protein